MERGTQTGGMSVWDAIMAHGLRFVRVSGGRIILCRPGTGIEREYKTWEEVKRMLGYEDLLAFSKRKAEEGMEEVRKYLSTSGIAEIARLASWLTGEDAPKTSAWRRWGRVVIRRLTAAWSGVQNGAWKKTSTFFKYPLAHPTGIWYNRWRQRGESLTT